ncbi:MAG: helicase C-terminal domain-containing protein [Ktedonobacteraceae bacterium]
MADAEVELRQIGPYAITRKLTTGSTSDLYLGKQRKKDIVIEVFHTFITTLAAKEAFLARIKQLKKLKHRNIAEVLDGGFSDLGNGSDEYGYLVMQSIEGETTQQRFAPNQRYTVAEVKPFISTIASALHYAHVSAIIHGNLHPGNILIDSRNDILLTHFSLDPPQSLLPFAQEQAAMPYMAPEQLRGIPSTDSDQYALAVMAYEWLCGRRPYVASTKEELLYQQEHELMPAPRSLNEALSATVERVLLQALAYTATERFQHCQEFADNYLHAIMGLPLKTAPRRAAPIYGVTAIINNGATQLDSANKATNTLPLDHIEPKDISSKQTAPIIAESSSSKTNGRNKSKLPQDAYDVKDALIELRPSVKRENERQDDIAPTYNDEARLHNHVTADLCQGGILSQSLPGYEERPAQIEMATVVARSLTQNIPAIIEAGTGTGKALDVETPIATSTGWKRMGDLIVGDFVFDEKGNPTRVTAVFDVMYDHKCYEVVFSDGSSLIADAEHEWVSYTAADRKWINTPKTATYTAKNFITSNQLAMLDELIAYSQNESDILSIDEATVLIGGHHWSVYQAAHKIAPVNTNKQPARYPRSALLMHVRDRMAKDLLEQRRDGRSYTLITTEKMADTLTVSATSRANHAIKVAGPLTLPSADLPIAPYFLGVWLGDGSSRSSQITTADPDLITEIEKDGYTVRSLKRPYLYAVDDESGKATNRWQPGMTGRLRTLGLWLNKHIPTIYLRSSEQQRRDLLAGLLDTDGTVSHTGAVEFTTTSPQLAYDTHELACSLGLRPTLRCGRARLNGKDCGPKWTLAFTTKTQVFRLPRKVNTHKERLRNYSPERNRFRYVVAIREVPSRPVRCIQVDAQSHLYLAGKSMIPTHNSLAYLVPIVRSGKVAIISTANKALQEQLFYKDIPFVQQHIKPFDAALVKGVGNYLCLDRMESERNGMQYYAKNREFTRLVDITNDPDAAFNGDFETLDFPLSTEIRSKVCTDSDQCAWSKCSFFSDCYVRKMRAKAERAQVIVVNHTLLLLDAAMDGYLLPERDIIVLDEAHHLEEEATRSFTITISSNSVVMLLAQRMLKDHSQLSLQDNANRELMHAWERLRLVADPGYKGRANLQAPFEEGLKLATAIADLADSLRKQRPKNMPEKEEQLFDKLLKRTQNLAQNIRTVFAVDQPDKFVYYVERVGAAGQRGGPQLQVSAAPLDVTEWLKERLFDKCNVICTSATLATVGPNPVRPEEKGPNFAYYRRRIGLNDNERYKVLESILPLSFDYESNALLYLPRDVPAPVYGAGSDDYTKAIAREMYRLVKFSHGRAFLLFSSKRMLDQAYDLMSPFLDYPLLRQGDMSRIELTRRFREEQGAILFGLKSFWEGVDIAGEALSLVVIDKLPFDPPDDPVHEARVAQMKAAGENWFGIYVLPQAVLRLKQGLGRLLRSREDRGVMAILDSRLYSKGYGKLVLDALPPARRTSNIKEVDRFFNEEQ